MVMIIKSHYFTNNWVQYGWMAFGFLFSVLVCASDDTHSIYGTGNHDELIGTSFDDAIYGGEGNDTLYASEGKDTLYGGPGADQFVVDAWQLDSPDTVKDFSPEEGDSITLRFRSPSIKNMRIPKELGTETVKLDKNGNLKILMDNQQWFTLMNIENAKLYFEVQNESDLVRFVFKKGF
ncbi:MAG: hypothetical protein ACJA1U_002695 [Bermanella sp.]|jgi:hypothetical protein